MHTDSLLFTLHSLCCQHIDQIMSSHGKQIMQAVTLILEAEHSIEVKEQVSTPSTSCSQTVVLQLHCGEVLTLCRCAHRPGISLYSVRHVQ